MSDILGSIKYSAGSIQQIDNYVALTKELETRGVPKETTMVGLTERAARPLIREQNPIIKEKAIESIKKCLESGKKPDNSQFIKNLTSNDVTKIKAGSYQTSRPIQP